jgi:cytochrome c oxidase accessory protein FixG
MSNPSASRIAAVELHDQEPAGSLRYVDGYVGGTVYTRRIRGYFQRLRRKVAWPLMVLFFAMPWLSWNGQPLMLFDLSAQKFHIFTTTYWPQDGILLAWLLMISAFALFAVTVWVGRVWCGFACPQTVWTNLYIWVEDFCEGDRHQRIRLDASPWNWNKLKRKGGKHALWGLLAVATGITFVAYFYGITALLDDLLTLQASLEAWFWVALVGGFTYLNAGWLREQVCRFMCPYSRFQSVMYDQDTLVVNYDRARGEPRRGQTGAKGDCVDCDWCVQVCPADIDIRDGLQAECISCGLCIDACDQVMDKLSLPRGLIRFSPERARTDSILAPLRPRLLGYFSALAVLVGVMVYMTLERRDLSLDVIRDRGVHLYRLQRGQVENVYVVKLNNMSERERLVDLFVSGEAGFRINSRSQVLLEPGEVLALPVRIRLPVNQVVVSAQDIELHAWSDGEHLASQKTRFLGPGPTSAASPGRQGGGVEASSRSLPQRPRPHVFW